MTKKEVQKRILQGGKPLALSKFSWDSKTNTFSSKENNLIIDFAGIGGCTFTTGWGCTFKTGGGCTFTTGGGCTFKTGGDCTFKTGVGCTFNTGGDCTFKTGWDCTWYIDGKEYPFPPLRFNGSSYSIEFSKKGHIRIGCEEKSVADWKKEYKKLAEKHEFTPKQLQEYKLYFEFIVKWMKKNKLD